MLRENGLLIGIGVATLAIVIAGVFFLTKGPKPTKSDPNFDASVLTQNVKHSKGDPNSQIKVVEFGDIQCPACKQAQPIVERILSENPDIYFVFRHYPLSFHKNAKIAAQAAEAASAQGKFFEMIHIQYDKQAQWAEKANPREDFRKFAQELGLNMDQFNKDMEDLKDQIESDYAMGNSAGVESTPTFFINGQKYPGVIQYDQFKQLVSTQPTTESTPQANQ